MSRLVPILDVSGDWPLLSRIVIWEILFSGVALAEIQICQFETCFIAIDLLGRALFSVLALSTGGNSLKAIEPNVVC